MVKFTKSKLPLMLLIFLAVFWSFYYQSNTIFNDYGQAKFEWLLLIDTLFVIPLACFICIENKQQAFIKSILYICLLIMLGSFIIPESEKSLWHTLELSRYLLLACFVLFEIIAIAAVIIAIKANLNSNMDPDIAISKPIESKLGEGNLGRLLSFEARAWTYLLFGKHIKPTQFCGNYHFGCHKKDGTESNMLGFILLIAFEIPIAHVVIHFLWSPLAAYVITGLTALSLVFFIAEYRAISKRPISLTNEEIIIRYGIYQPLTIAFTEIKTVRPNDTFIKRGENVKRYNHSGVPNVEIALINGEKIYLGIDTPTQFISLVEGVINEH